VFRTTGVCRDRLEAWAAVVPGDRAVALWEELASSPPPGWWPVILGGEEDENRLAEAVTHCKSPPDAIVAKAATLDPKALFETWKRENEPIDKDEEWDPVGEWPEAARPSNSFMLPFDIRTKRPRPTVVAVVAVADHTEVPAALCWGAWNACPAPEEHVAVMRRWSDRYGAQLVGISSDVIEMRVKKPPSTRDAALVVAEEQFAYCSDIVLQGTQSVRALAATLLNGTAWYFWWD
jgi:hypothetical protein